MKTYKQLISELSLTKLVRYRTAAQKEIRDLSKPHGEWKDYISNKRVDKTIKRIVNSKPTDFVGASAVYGRAAEGQRLARTKGVETATKKINRKIHVGKLAKPLEK